MLAADKAAVESARGSLLTLVGALSDLPWLILIPILAFFLLKDAAGFRRTIVTALPHQGPVAQPPIVRGLECDAGGIYPRTAAGLVLVGSLCLLGFAVLGIPYPVPLGMLAGVLEFIPLIGPLLLAVVASIAGALHSPILVLWTVGFLGVLRVIEDYVIYPRLISRGVQLHPLAVIVAVLTGAELDGIAGMFLAVPAVAIASVVCRHWLEWRSEDVAADRTLLHEQPQGPHD